MKAWDTGGRLGGLGLCWLAGVALQLQERSLLPIAEYAAALAAGALLLVFAGCRPKAWFVALLGLALVAFGATGWRATARLSEVLPAALEGRDLQLEGVVASLPQVGASGLRFRFQVERAESNGERVEVPPLLALGWYRGFHEDAAVVQPRNELRAGQRWRFTARLRRPHGNINPHGFDYELYLFELGVGASGYVRDAPSQRLDSAAGFFVERLRQTVRDAIEANVGDRRIAGVLAALAIGDQAAIDRADWDLFRNTGVAHLMSISGLHVTMFAWLAGLLVAWLWRRSTRASLCRPAPVAARWGGLLAAAGYALLSGWGVPAQRTVWMLATVTGLQALGFAWPLLLVLLAAAAVVTLLDPWALLQPGFWLSFGAVGLLMVSQPAPAQSKEAAQAGGIAGLASSFARTAKGGVRTQLIATLGLTPLTLVFFQQVSLVGLAANLLAIPLVTLVITPLALLGILATPLWALGAWVTQLMVNALGVLAGLPFAVWSVAAAPPWAQIAALLGSVLLIMPLPWRAKFLALPLVWPLLMPPVARPETGRFDLVALDVGQGTAVLVRTREHLLIYDAGPQYSRDSDAGQRVLLPVLRGRGENKIDLLMLSHRDIDHVGGARALLAALPVHQLSSSLEPGHPLVEAARSHSRCEAGQSWLWDGVRFEVLHPRRADYDRQLRPNAMSCVLRISSASGSVLLTGDIEREQELALVANYAESLRSDVLVAPHHGSRTSSTAEFLDTVQAKLAVFQAGYRNRFGHPVPEVVDRYVQRGIVAIQSPQCGAWSWPQGSAHSGICQRDISQRYWRHGAVPEVHEALRR